MNPITERFIEDEIRHVEARLADARGEQESLLRQVGRTASLIVERENILSALQADLFGHDGRHFTPDAAPRTIFHHLDSSKA